MNASFKQALTSLLKGRRALLTLPLAGLGILMLATSFSPPPERTSHQAQALAVDTLTINSQPLIPRALAYGSVEPNVLWQAIAEVSGRISYLHPELKDGNTLAAGTEVLRIDSRDYELTLSQAQAELAVQQANLEQLVIEQDNGQRSLAIAQRSLKVAQAELARKARLLNKGGISQTQVDQEERNLLAQELETQKLSSQLDSFPSQIKVAQAQRALAQASVEEQARNLARTRITLPFDARIGPVNAEQDVFLGAGNPLFEAYDLARVEIRAQLPMTRMRPLVAAATWPSPEASPEPRPETKAEPSEGIKPAPMTTNLSTGSTLQTRTEKTLETATPPVPTSRQLPLTRTMLKSLSLKAEARWLEAGGLYQWQASVQRMGDTLDASSRALTVVVAVEQPFELASPGGKPPLFKGMYMEVELQGPARPHIVIPRFAIHRGHVYLVRDQRLTVQPVEVDFTQGDLAIIKSGLQDGDQLVVDDLVPAVPGMPLNARHDSELQHWLSEQAQARLPLNGARP